MAITEPDHDGDAVGDAETLVGLGRTRPADSRGEASGDGLDELDALEDRLLHRELKARLFGSDVQVRIGRYDVMRRIGGGGMGTVYVAHDADLDRRVALKLLRPDRHHGAQRMLQEARALARLTSPHVVAIHEVGTHEGLVYLAMELVQGRTLRQWLQEPRPRHEIFAVFLQAAKGLQAAHAARLVHRDVKPDNLLIGDDGRVRVVDFGLAKAGDEREATPTPAAVPTADTVALTVTGALLGTPAYMAPEQFLGAAVDARTDVFAFCVMLFETLAGQRPFDGDDVPTLARAVVDTRARRFEAAGVPDALARLIDRGLSREPRERPATMSPYVEALEAVLVARPRRPARRVAFVGLMVASGAAVYAGARQRFDAMTTGTADAGVHVGEAVADDAEEAAALAPLLDATAPTDRLALAEAFLADHGESAAPWRRAIAHAAAAAVQWQRSCTAAVDGLCVVTGPEARVDCDVPPLRPLTRIARDPELVASARRHLDAVMAVAGVAAGGDDGERVAFAAAVADASLTLADADLEVYLELTPPGDLDFEGARGLSEQAFGLFIDRMMTDGERLVTRYAAVKPYRDVRANLRAAGRTGLLYEAVASAILRAGPGVDAQQACAELSAGFVDPVRVLAADAYDWCLDAADAADLRGDAAAHWCLLRAPLARPSP
ncbi:MAG: serine/threonine protein kinase [Deltaproteobacteria bacterium]|nr:serine/threonine protein kinase [Deltaproteobacteria bacterium]MBK8720285.1 serine/threonine protein kinase [Deltaproteobacteria bacterium]MBP7287654.1 serine/threonine protein kinase [Nannocystaceae bacterium]